MFLLIQSNSFHLKALFENCISKLSEKNNAIARLEREA